MDILLWVDPGNVCTPFVAEEIFTGLIDRMRHEYIIEISTSSKVSGMSAMAECPYADHYYSVLFETSNAF